MTNLINHETLAYCVGGIGILLEWHAYHLTCGKAFRRWSALGAIFWAGQYALLNAWTAGLTMGFTAVRTLMSSDNREHGIFKHWTASGFCLIFGILTMLSWQGWVSLLPAAAVINTTLALFYLDNKSMRIALLASSFAWISNDLYWHAWPALIAESVAMGINIHTIHSLMQKAQSTLSL